MPAAGVYNPIQIPQNLGGSSRSVAVGGGGGTGFLNPSIINNPSGGQAPQTNFSFNSPDAWTGAFSSLNDNIDRTQEKIREANEKYEQYNSQGFDHLANLQLNKINRYSDDLQNFRDELGGLTGEFTQWQNFNTNRVPDNTSGLAHDFAGIEFEQRLKDLENFQRIQEQAEINDEKLRDVQNKALGLVDPIFRGQLLEGTAFERLGKDLTGDQAGALFKQEYDPIESKLADLGLTGSGVQGELAQQTKDRVSLYNEAKKADELEFLLNFALGVPGATGVGTPPTYLGSISEIPNALNLAMNQDQNLWNRRMDVERLNEAKRSRLASKIDNIRSNIPTVTGGLDNPALSLAQSPRESDVVRMADEIFERLKKNRKNSPGPSYGRDRNADFDLMTQSLFLAKQIATGEPFQRLPGSDGPSGPASAFPAISGNTGIQNWTPDYYGQMNPIEEEALRQRNNARRGNRGRNIDEGKIKDGTEVPYSSGSSGSF